MTVAEVLKAAGIADDVAAGLPAEVVTALTGFVSDADTKLTTAQQENATAAELRRQAELDAKEVREYVERYGTSLTEFAGTNAEMAAMKAYLESLKNQGIAVPANLLALVSPNPANPNPANPVARVPGSPAIGGNADFDPAKFRGQVGDMMSQMFDAQNEYQRLYGAPIPDNSTQLAQEASRARKPVGQYIAEKYDFAGKRKVKEQEAFDARVKAEVDKQVEAKNREIAERNGSNPNLRPGESSRNSVVQTIKSDDFHKADGNVPTRERQRRMLDRIHADVRRAQSA